MTINNSTRVTVRPSRALLLALLGMTTIAAVGVAQLAKAQTVPPLQWSACPAPPPGFPDAGQQCATIAVPLDYRIANGQTINVAVSRVRAANPSLRRGVLFVNVGGPGGAQIDAPRFFTVALPQAVRDRYDLVSFDPRFMNRSTPITCGLTSQQANQAYPMLEQPGGFSAGVSFAQYVADSCALRSGHLSPFLTTRNIARDMDRIRQALGETKISYFAYSWGTYIGIAYDKMFPGRTDRMLLDSSLNPSWMWRQQFRSWGRGGQLRFPDFAKFAADNDAIFHLGTTPEQITTLYFQLVNQLDLNPMPFPALFPDGTLVNGAMFRELNFLSLYQDSNFPQLANLWVILRSGSAPSGGGAPSVSSVPVDNKMAAGLTLACSDVAWPRSVSQYQTELAQDSQQYPMFGPFASQIWPCAFWHHQPIESPVQPSVSGPSNILMLHSLRDPAAPYQGGQQLRNILGARARLVTVDAGSHDIYGHLPNTCVNNAATGWLANGTFPAADISCPKQ